MILLTWLGGCVINGDKWTRPRDLVPAWMVDRPRILAVAAQPPEAAPGDTVTFSALVGRPPGEDDADYRVWLACPLTDSTGAGCGTSLEGFDPETLDPEELAALGLIGFEPFLPPVYVVPDDALDGLTADERREGTYVLVQTTILPPDALDDDAVDLDPAEVEASIKRLVVSEAPTPNHNPAIAAFGVDGLRTPAGAVVHVDPLQVYEIEVVLGVGSVEHYEFVNRDGEQEERVEEPYVAWFSTGGDLVEDVTLYPYLQATWVAPEEPGTAGTWFAVARDRRGGLAWWTQPWVVDEPTGRAREAGSERSSTRSPRRP